MVNTEFIPENNAAFAREGFYLYEQQCQRCKTTPVAKVEEGQLERKKGDVIGDYTAKTVFKFGTKAPGAGVQSWWFCRHCEEHWKKHLGLQRWIFCLCHFCKCDLALEDKANSPGKKRKIKPPENGGGMRIRRR